MFGKFDETRALDKLASVKTIWAAVHFFMVSFSATSFFFVIAIGQGKMSIMKFSEKSKKL